ncbi:MAG: hypothetical protein AAF614_18110, partial [Chloroflexota bacterium]
MSKDKDPHIFSQVELPKDLIIEISSPNSVPDSNDSLELHAARILLLLKHAGGKRGKNKGRIVGRTKLAKLDFFVRYPTYLAKAQNTATDPSKLPRPDSPMIRYKYGPWDDKYYNVFALLISRGLVSITPSKDGDNFMLTERGFYAVRE